MQRFRHLTGNGGYRAAVFQLRDEHPLLHMPREHGQQRQNQQQQNRQSRVLHRDHHKDGKDSACVRRHRDHAGGEQRLNRVHIAGEPRGSLAGVLRRKRRGRKPRQLPGHFGTEHVRHPLAKHLQQGLLRGGKHALQRQAAEIQQRGAERKRHAARQVIDDPRQHQRRKQRGQHRSRRAEHCADAEQLMLKGRVANGGKH